MMKLPFAFAIIALGCPGVAVAQFEEDDLSRPSLGLRLVHLNTVRSKIKETIKLPADDGAIVLMVTPNSAGDVAGVQLFDIIQDLNGVKIDSLEKYSEAIKSINVGKACDFKVLRSSNNNTEWKSRLQGKITPIPSGQSSSVAMKKKTDKVEGVTWMYHAESPESRAASGQLNAYFALEKGIAKNLRLVCSVKSRLIPIEEKKKADVEKAALSKLKLAKQLIDKGKKSEAVKRLKSLLDEFPETEAAKEAGELLSGLGG